MKSFKKILWILLGLIPAFLLFSLWYQHRYSMEVVEPYEVNAPNLKKRLLIATQGSDFKDMITTGIVDHYRSVPIFIKVMDISSLNTIEPEDFNAIVVIHTWENWKPPMEVQSFMERTKNDIQKMVVLTTSGKGSYKMDGVDAITGESIIGNAPVFVNKVIKKLDSILLIPQL